MLERIQKANDIKNIDPKDREALAQEIRDFLIESVSETGGHLGSNLGTVELTMALHLSLDLPKDKIIWDVGHQSYTHKLLTGRREGFSTLRKFHGMSGFPKRGESDCDAFDTGHSSTSVSAGLGMVCARDLRGGDETIVSVIGDGALTGGMAYEAMNNAGRLKSNFIIILNDNNMSISENVGGVPDYLNSLRTSEGYQNLKEGIYNTLMRAGNEGVVKTIQRTKNGIKQFMSHGMLFENMGLTYLGPVDGHDIDELMRVLRYAKRVKHGVIIHVLTVKGKGYEPAEKHPARFHGAEPFEVETGLPKRVRQNPNYTDVFATVMCKLAGENDKLVAITAAMPDGTGLKRFHNRFADRFFDVGIAEEHAVTFAAGMAAGGLHPVFAVYSSFLQRAYDQILHDVCIQHLPVTFAVDRAGIVGSDGETHQGIFDLSYLSSIPGMVVSAPKNKWELADLLRFAVKYDGPMAIRYPRGESYAGLKEFRAPVELGKSEVIYEEGPGSILLLVVGSMIPTALEVRNRLKEEGHSVSLVNVRFVKPIDPHLFELAAEAVLTVTMEENVITGGFGERFLEEYEVQRTSGETKKTGSEVCIIALPDSFVEHGSADILKKEYGIDADATMEKIHRGMSSK